MVFSLFGIIGGLIWLVLPLYSFIYLIFGEKLTNFFLTKFLTTPTMQAVICRFGRFLVGKAIEWGTMKVILFIVAILALFFSAFMIFLYFEKQEDINPLILSIFLGIIGVASLLLAILIKIAPTAKVFITIWWSDLFVLPLFLGYIYSARFIIGAEDLFPTIKGKIIFGVVVLILYKILGLLLILRTPNCLLP